MGYTDMKFMILAALAAVASARPYFLPWLDPTMVELEPWPPGNIRMAQDEDRYQPTQYHQDNNRSDSLRILKKGRILTLTARKDQDEDRYQPTQYHQDNKRPGLSKPSRNFYS